MKRDVDLIRKILLELEKAPFDGTSMALSIDERDPEEVNCHCLLLTEARLIESATMATMGRKAPRCQPIRLTWAGYEFLDAARDDQTWKKAVKLIGRQGGVAFEVLLKYPMQELEQRVLGASSTAP